MSADDREARRLAVEAAARELVRMYDPITDDSVFTDAARALRAAVRRLDAPRYEIRERVGIAPDTGWSLVRVAGDRATELGVIYERNETVEVLRLLNDAEGR